MARVEEGSFLSEAHGSVRIRTKSWVPVSNSGGDGLLSSTPPVAVLVWSHGIHEHLGRFENLYHALVAQNVAVHAWDHVGHGESGNCGPKKHQIQNGFDAVVKDATQYARSVRSKYPDTVPMFLGGVSFGGLVAAHASVRIERLHGTVLVAPCIDVEWTPLLRFQARIGSFLARVCPHVRGAAAVAPDRLSSDPDAIKEYRNDPLVEVANVRFLAAFEILKGFRKLIALKSQFKTPLLVIHGTKDAACFYPASDKFVKDVATPSGDKSFVSVENGSHLLLHDAATKQAVVDEIVAFIRARL
jgi:acylglycerol lipase